VTPRAFPETVAPRLAETTMPGRVARPLKGPPLPPAVFAPRAAEATTLGSVATPLSRPPLPPAVFAPRTAETTPPGSVARPLTSPPAGLSGLAVAAPVDAAPGWQLPLTKIPTQAVAPTLAIGTVAEACTTPEARLPMLTRPPPLVAAGVIAAGVGAVAAACVIVAGDAARGVAPTVTPAAAEGTATATEPAAAEIVAAPGTVYCAESAKLKA